MRIRPGTVVAVIALIAATAGTTYALTVPKKSVGPKQLRAGAVRTPKIANGAVTAPKLSPVVTRTASDALVEGGEGRAVARCRAGEQLIGGGGAVEEPAGPDTPVVASRPSVGDAAPGEGQSPDSWLVRAMNASGGASPATVVRAWALCRP